VAVAIVQEALDMAYANAQAEGELDAYNQTQKVAEQLVSAAWDVEYKPTAERLVITIDAGVTSGEAMRSTPEDQPPEVGPASTA
jgi:hypothetical protein